MAVISVIEGLAPSPDLEAQYFYFYLITVFGGLLLLYGFSPSGRPVAHPDRQLGSKHKAAQAEWVEILERLYGSKVTDSNFRGGPDDVRLALSVAHGISDVDKDTLCSPLLDFTIEGTEATVTLSSGANLRSSVVESMKEVSAAPARGQLVDEIIVFSTAVQKTLQTKVELRKGICERLKKLVKLTRNAAPLRKERTANRQIDNWAILKPSIKRLLFESPQNSMGLISCDDRISL